MGAAIMGIDNLKFIDAYFLACSAMTNSGLATISMLDVSPKSFAIVSVLMLIGCPPFMLIMTTFFRKYKFRQVQKKVSSYYANHIEEKQRLRLTAQNKATIAYYETYDYALTVLICVFISYYITWLSLGVFAEYGALFIKPLPDELQHRAFNRFQHAAFTVASAFSNTGLTLTSDSLVSMADNPTAYCILTVLITAGNTAMPIFLRFFVKLLLRIEQWLTRIDPRRNRRKEVKLYRRALYFISTHPRKLTTHIFDQAQTFYLGLMVILFILIQYIFFLASTLNRKEALVNHSKSELAGIGYFQTLSTRTAGFAIMDLRILSEGLLVIYSLMMYLSAFPLVTTMIGSQEARGEENLSTAVLSARGDNASVADAETASNADTVGRVRRLSLMASPGAGTHLNLTMLEEASRAVQGDSRGGYGNIDKLLSPADNSSVLLPHTPPRSYSPLATEEAQEKEKTDDSLPAREREKRKEEKTYESSVTPSSLSPVFPSPLDLEAGLDSLTSSDGFIKLDRSDERFGVQNKRRDSISVQRNKLVLEDEEGEEEEAGDCNETEKIKEEGAENWSEDSQHASMHSSLRDDSSVDQSEIEQLNKSFASHFLFRHSFLILIAVIILAYSEEALLRPYSKVQANLFYVIFELISAYGNVGLSVGVPGKAYSLCGEFTLLGKLTLITIMILGKHRGLPASSDEVIDYQFAEYQKAWQYAQAQDKTKKDR